MRALILIVGILLSLLSVLTMSNEGLTSDKARKQANEETREAKDKQVSPSNEMPVYKPPLRGAPLGRVGGGTRGAGNELPSLTALVPDHVGLTIQEQPPLYWYLSKPTNYHVEFTLIDDESIEPLVEKRIDPPVPAGFHSIRLKDTTIHLSKGKQYKWYIAVVVDPDYRSKDLIAGGLIKRVEVPAELQKRLSLARQDEVPNIYADSGMWYDTLSSMTDLIDSMPDNRVLRSKRTYLLKQVGLSLEND